MIRRIGEREGKQRKKRQTERYKESVSNFFSKTNANRCQQSHWMWQKSDGVRMLRTSPATRSFWTAAEVGSAGISWPHPTDQALHIETKKGHGNWQIRGNMIQHDPTWSNMIQQIQPNSHSTPQLLGKKKKKSLGSKPKTCCRSLGSESQALTFLVLDAAMPEIQLRWRCWRSGCSSICCSQTVRAP